jgi:uncharacterized protein (TIGR02996 family)
MTEDEAFIRAIVDSPSDEGPRLVYADWLEEHSDPRGVYLRAEHKWASTRKGHALTKVRELAQPLDAVWVARVSRPPVGVCVEAPLFRPAKKLTTEAAIHSEESTFGVRFPPEYRAFLLNYNGGGFLYPLTTPDGDLDEGAFSNVFAGIGLGKKDFLNLAKFVDLVFDGGNGINLRSGLFPIGGPDHERMVYLLGVAGEYLGRVYVTEEPADAWSVDESGDRVPEGPARWLYADSFPGLLAELSKTKDD